MPLVSKSLCRIVILLCTLIATQASASNCTPYERQVYDVAKAVAKFRQTPGFTKTYGWSAAGPYQKWITQLQALSDEKEQARTFLITHEFAPMEIYSVADEYRTAGKLDSYYQDIDRNIKAFKCK